MKMEKLPMCRLCTVENVNMYVVVNKNLQEIYEKLTDIPFVTEDNRPMLACFFCCTKLKQCWRLLRKCLEAEKLFAQMLNEEYEIKPQVNQDQLEFSGYIISPTVHISLSDECQTESDFIKEELPDVCEGRDDANQTEPENEFQEYLDSYSDHKDIPPPLESKNIPPHHSESENLLAQDFEPEGEEHSESDSEDDVPLMKLKTQVEEEQKIFEMKRKADDTNMANVVKKPKKDIGRAKLEDTSEAQQKNSEHSILKSSKPSLNNSINDNAFKTYCHIKSNKGIDNSDRHIQRKLCIKEKPYNCEICQRSFTQKSHLTRHFRLHTGAKPYKCDICQHSFSAKSSLLRHIRIHNGDKPYKCEICQRSFTDKSSLTRHIRVHTGIKPYKCDICQRSFSEKANLIKHISVHTGNKPYKCDLCKRRFVQKVALTRHVCAHAGDKAYKCDICLRSFSEKINLAQHILFHTGVKPYKCVICQRGFSARRTVKTHIRVHTGERPYKCAICQRSFSVKFALTRHIRVHTRVKP